MADARIAPTFAMAPSCRSLCTAASTRSKLAQTDCAVPDASLLLRSLATAESKEEGPALAARWPSHPAAARILA
ncbi:MAG TPA: hypothetical protein VKB14_04025 [Actinomycetales bacterium]|nr:hypothetical protein [Actinomycetales bacterium]